MSFSAIMDEIPSQDPDLEIPTRPVTPVDNAMLGVPAKNNGLYHSDSVNKVLHELSRNLSGICDNTIFSSKADKMPPPPEVGSQSDIHFAYGFKQNTGDPSFLSGSSALPIMSVSPADCTLNPPAKDKAMNVALDLMHFYHSSSPEPPSLSNNFDPQSTSSAPATSSYNSDPTTIDAAASPSLSPSLAPSSASPKLLQPQPTSSQSTSTSASSNPGGRSNNVFSPTPSTPALSFDGVVSGSDHEWREHVSPATSKRPRVGRRATRDSAASTSTATRSTPSSSKSKPPTTNSLPLTPSMPLISPLQPQIPNGYIVPSSEINSDFEDDGEEDMTDQTYALGQQNPYSGGPIREKVRDKAGEKLKGPSRVKQRKGKEEWLGAAEASHPYKGLKTLGVPTSGSGRQRCSYVSPYDGWKCDQVLARSYDVPRHMEVHAKEEYELVITGKLVAERSELYTCVTEANMYVCLVCHKDFSRKDAMQRHVRNSAKMSKAKHRAENAKMSMKKRVLGDPIVPHPYDILDSENGGGVPAEILDRHRALLNNLKEEAIALGQDVSDWDVEEMVPKLGGGLFGTSNVGDLYAGMRDKAPGIPVGRRGGNKHKTEAAKLRTLEDLPRTRGGNRGALKTAGASHISSQATTPKTNPSIAGGSQERAPATPSEDDELISNSDSSPEEEEPMETD